MFRREEAYLDIELSVTELRIIRQSLRAAIDLGDRYFTFCPDTSFGGAKVYYGEGNTEKQAAIEEMAHSLRKKIDEIIKPVSLESEMEMLRDMQAELSRKKKAVDVRQEEFTLPT